jgi:hypothetical protein
MTMVNEALIERLGDLRDAEWRGAPMALLDDFAAALKAAEAQGEEWKRHYDKATERLAAYSRDFAAEHKSLTAARSVLTWVRQVYPARLSHGAAGVEMTWDEFNDMRRAIGLAPLEPGREKEAKAGINAQLRGDLAAARAEIERLSQRCIDIIEIELKINADQMPAQVADRCLDAIRAAIGEQGK